MIISRSVLIRMGNVSDKCCGENYSIFCVRLIFPKKSCRLLDNVEKYGPARQVTDDTIRRMCIACWIPKATDTHSEYAIIIEFLRQQWLDERAPLLRLYLHCLSCIG